MRTTPTPAKAPEVSRRGEADTLEAGCAQLGVSLPPGAVQRMSAYLDLLEKWNRAYNLTAIRRREDMVVRHLLDSLAVLPLLKGRRFLDVGSGAGLPGIPLAICLPEWEFVLLDSNGKKTRFLFQASLALALDNIRVVDSRVESYRPEKYFDGVLSRAFASLPQMVTLCGRLVDRGQALYAMKGSVPQGEAAVLLDAGIQVDVDVLEVPGLDEQRSLVTIYP